jgi:isoquinoline 1-oxidoreductase beta subunit
MSPVMTPIAPKSVTRKKLNRRNFLQAGATAAGGLMIGFYLPERSPLAAQAPAAANAAQPSKLNAFVRIGADDSVTLMIHKSEMGQGTVTSLSMLLAEELECDWNKIRTEFPLVDPAYGAMMGAYGSLSIRTSWQPLRQAGAQAREMLISAAAERWGIDKSQCKADNGSVVNASNNAKLSFGSLADAASKLPVPPVASIKLKDPAQYRLIGTSKKRLDTASKVNGTATFGLDVKRPGMLYASLERCPVFGGKVASFDATKAKAVPGVKDVVQISNGVAVLADNTWSAAEGRKALTIQWDEGSRANTSSASLRQMFMDLTAKPGAVARNTGDADMAMAGAAKKLEAVYEAPYLSHAPMEPLNCVAHVTADRCEVWSGTQIQSVAQQTVAQITKLPANKIDIHTLYLGGGFGRRGGADFVGEAVEIAKAVTGTPVKLTWTREDDLQHDTYRPASYTTFATGLDADGWPIALTGRVACPSFGGLRNGVDSTGVEGIITNTYDIPNQHFEYHPPDAGIPVSYWRSVGFSQNCFFMESFIDEMAAATNKDPVEFRRRLLSKDPKNARYLNVLNLAADKAGWGKPLPAGHFHGVALVNNIGTFNAQVAEISVAQGKVKVHRVVCAVDCGQIINRDGVTQQIESGIVYGLSAALKIGITLDHGRVQQKNFNNYDPLRIDEMPVVEVHLVDNHESPGGIGEASTPSIIPAVTNAVFAATGKRIRSLPIKAADLV